MRIIEICERERVKIIIVVLLLLTSPAAAQTIEHWADGTTVEWRNNYHTAIISGRHRVGTAAQHWNPVWWFRNDFEPQAPGWYKPGKPQWWRQLSWYLRNPFQNAGRYVFGIADRNYRVDGNVDLRRGADLYPDTGCIRLKFSHISGLRPGAHREFVSCVSRNVLWYVGTQWTGFYGLKFNLLHSLFQLW